MIYSPMFSVFTLTSTRLSSHSLPTLNNIDHFRGLVQDLRHFRFITVPTEHHLPVLRRELKYYFLSRFHAFACPEVTTEMVYEPIIANLARVHSLVQCSSPLSFHDKKKSSFILSWHTSSILHCICFLSFFSDVPFSQPLPFGVFERIAHVVYVYLYLQKDWDIFMIIILHPRGGLRRGDRR